ncbi:MAG: alpha/beta hydrolase [Gemmatimonadetes bacterium]|nr:alpha/beta hydrolase [Gemmatimonadota bacterium]
MSVRVVLLRLVVMAGTVYVALGMLLFFARDFLVFPGRHDATPEPRRIGIADGEKVWVTTADGERLVGWYLPPRDASGARAGALIWFHGNGETIGGLAPILREFRPQRAALLALDYRGYGESTGRAGIEGVKRDAEAGWTYLAGRPEIDPARIVVYGRSVGSGPAVHLALQNPVAGLILESPFTSLRAMARVHYPLFPSFIAGSGLDNLRAIAGVRCPVLFVHGDADRLIPIWMGRALAERVGAGAEFHVIAGADHNDTYDTGGEAYVRRVQDFVTRVTAP